jgi:hypothetical protein
VNGLDLLKREADDWLREQPSDVPLCPCAVVYFKRRFCLPWPLVKALRREIEKEKEKRTS